MLWSWHSFTKGICLQGGSQEGENSSAKNIPQISDASMGEFRFIPKILTNRWFVDRFVEAFCNLNLYILFGRTWVDSNNCSRRPLWTDKGLQHAFLTIITFRCEAVLEGQKWEPLLMFMNWLQGSLNIITEELLCSGTSHCFSRTNVKLPRSFWRKIVDCQVHPLSTPWETQS